MSNLIKLENIIRTKDNKKSLIQCLKNEDLNDNELIDAAVYTLRNCQYEYFDLIHNKIYNQYSCPELREEYFVIIINVAAKYNKFDVYKKLFNDPKFNEYVNNTQLIEILANCSPFYRPFSFSMTNVTLDKDSLFELLVKFLSRENFTSVKSAEKSFGVFLKKYKIDFQEFFDYVEERNLFYSFRYGRSHYSSKNFKVTFYDLIIKLDKKNTFFHSLDRYIDYINNNFAEKYLQKQNQLKIYDKVECF